MAITHDGIIPLLTGEGRFPAVGSAELPLLTGSAHFAAAGSAELPLLTSSGAVESGVNSTGDADLILLSGSGLMTQTMSGSAELPFLTGSGSGLVGYLLTGAAALPLASGAGRLYSPPVYIGAGVLPILAGTGAVSLVETGAYTVLVVNVENQGHSTYVSFPFTSFAYLDGKYYGCGTDGIYELTGDDDAGQWIECEALSGTTDFPDERNTEQALYRSRIDSVYVRCRLYNDISVVAIAGEEHRRERTIAVATDRLAQQGVHNRRFKLGRGLVANEWQFGVANVDGGDLEVEHLDVRPVKKSRRA